MNRRERRGVARESRRTGPACGPPGAGPAALLAAAAQHHRAGRLDRAEALYRKVLAAAPAQAAAWHGLAVLKHQRGRHDRALGLIGRAVTLRPADATYLTHQGEIQRTLGRHAEAVDSYRRALAIDPGLADARYGLGTALLELGRIEEAAAELGRAAALAPDDPEVLNNLGNALAEAGRRDEAIACYRHALALRPGYAECAVNLGFALAEAGRDDEAEACFRAAVAAAPELAEAWRRLGALLRRTDRRDEAARALGEAVRRAPGDARAHLELGDCLSELRRYEAALDHYRAAIARAPELAEAHLGAGRCLQYQGRFDEAARAHERALALRPDLARAHHSLALMARGGGAAERDTARLEALLARPDLPDEARIDAGFALARILDRRGEAGAAFTHLRRANALKARRVPFDAEQHAEQLERLIATFDAAFFAARPGFGVAADLPVFIVGMPRSGTTLVEQILAGHPAVHGAGELDDLRRLVQDLPQRLPGAGSYPECAAALDRETAAALARAYLDGLGRRGGAGARRVTDKLPGNFLRLGLIALLLPRARVVHCRRDPLDTCLSCYFQNFARGLGFTYDLRHLGLVYRGYERLMAHWRGVLPLAMLDVRYEELVADPEAVGRRLVAFCGLPWDDRCLAFHRRSWPVDSASFWQVRQPLYATSIGRWRAYARHLGPLAEALGGADLGGTEQGGDTP